MTLCERKTALRPLHSTERTQTMKRPPSFLLALCIVHCALCISSASAAVGDATVAKWGDDAKGAFMLMFDDGWPSLWQAAMPALEER